MSQGLVHSTDIKPAIVEAIDHQRIHGARPVDPTARIRSSVTPASLKADLALARAEIVSLRQSQREMQERIQRSLGAELHSLGQHDALSRIDDLEQSNRTLLATHDRLATQLEQETQTNANLQEEITSLRSAYSKLMRRINTSPSSG